MEILKFICRDYIETIEMSRRKTLVHNYFEIVFRRTEVYLSDSSPCERARREEVFLIKFQLGIAIRIKKKKRKVSNKFSEKYNWTSFEAKKKIFIIVRHLIV